MNSRIVAREIHSEISQANNILVVCHEEPDSDAFGSLTAFSQYLDLHQKEHTLFCAHAPQKHFLFLENIERLKTQLDEALCGALDLLVVLDSGDLHVTGIKDFIDNIPRTTKKINIDHHVTNVYFGDINFVLSEAVSTTEILYRMFTALDIEITREMAVSLMAGIIGDTNNFTNQNTTPECLEIASRLLSAGARLSLINHRLYKNKNLMILKHWGRVLNRLTINKEYNIAYTVVTSKDLVDVTSQRYLSEGLPNYLNSLSDARIILTLKEFPEGVIKGSLRTNDDLIDVSKLATLLGGGGHKKAAGFSLKGKLVETEKGWMVI